VRLRAIQISGLYSPLSVNIGVLLKYIIVQFQNCSELQKLIGGLIKALLTKWMVEQKNGFTISFNPPNEETYPKKRSPSSPGFISFFQRSVAETHHVIL